MRCMRCRASGRRPRSAWRSACCRMSAARRRSCPRRWQRALDAVGRCGRCRMLAEGELCALCASPSRDDSQLCVVESPADVIAVENSGALPRSVLRADGPSVAAGWHRPGASSACTSWICCCAEGRVREVILATNSTVEGEATAHRGVGAGARPWHLAPAHRAGRAVRRRTGIRGWRHAGACAGGSAERRLAARSAVDHARCALASGRLLPQLRRTAAAGGGSSRSVARRTVACLHCSTHRAVRLLHVAAILEAALRRAAAPLRGIPAWRVPGRRWQARNRARRANR